MIEPRWKLFDLYGNDQSWDTLQAHNVLWHDHKERGVMPLRLSGSCATGGDKHIACSGKRKVGSQMVRCACECHEPGAEVPTTALQFARTITLTEAGRAYLAALREAK